jgi:hypothetical protein
VASCEQLIDPWFQNHRGYNPLWSVDPPFDRNVFHWWEVNITGFNSGEGAALQYTNRELMHAIAVAGAVRMTALVAPAGPAEISILPRLQESALQPAEQPRDRGIAVRQQLVLQEGTIPLASTCKRILAGRVNGSMCVLAVMNDGVAAYDVSAPFRARPVGLWQIDHVRGVVGFDGGLLIYGVEGAIRVDRNGRSLAVVNQCAFAPILDFAASSGFLYAVLPNGVETWSRSNLCRVSQTLQEGSRMLLPVDGKLIVAGAGLAIYDLRDPSQPRHEFSACADMQIRELRRESGAPGNEFTALLEDGFAHSFRLSNKELQEAARYPEPPWFASTMIIGSAVVAIGSSGTTLEVSRLGASAIL